MSEKAQRNAPPNTFWRQVTALVVTDSCYDYSHYGNLQPT